MEEVGKSCELVVGKQSGMHEVEHVQIVHFVILVVVFKFISRG